MCGNVRAEGGHGQGILRDGGRVKTNQPFQILDPAETLPLLIQIYLASRVNFFYVLGLYTLVRVDSRAAFLGPIGL